MLLKIVAPVFHVKQEIWGITLEERESMTKSKHTPGPWEWARQVRKKGSWLEEKKPKTRMWSIHTEGKKGIAYIGPLAILSKNAIAEAEANAQLMATAPDLLEAAEAVIKFMDKINKQYPYKDPDGEICELKDLRKVIAKAKGE